MNIAFLALETQCLFMKNNQNFQKILLKLLENLDHKPKLLLHTCCGPCFTIPHEELKDYFDITLFFNNSNIFPKNEYERRLKELKQFLNDKCDNIKLIETTYNNDEYIKDLVPYKDQSEGHERCRICFRKRLEEGFKYAKENGFEYFGTVMTISRYKSAKDINGIGLELEKKYFPVKWLPADFKKNNGYEKSLVMIEALGMYFQQYCGCQFSYQKYLEKHQNLT